MSDKTWDPDEIVKLASALAVMTPYALPFSVLRAKQRAQCMIRILALRSRAWTAQAKHFLASHKPPGGPTKSTGWFWLLEGTKNLVVSYAIQKSSLVVIGWTRHKLCQVIAEGRQAGGQKDAQQRDGCGTGCVTPTSVRDGMRDG